MIRRTLRVFSVTLTVCASLSAMEYSTTSNWLVDLNATPTQMEAIQKQFRGFDTAMIEVGYRYEAIKKAVRMGNYLLASYHWDKIKIAIDNGAIRRPARKLSAEIFFLEKIYPQFRNALHTNNNTKINEVFEQIKLSCNTCHSDQKVGFIVIK